MTYENLASTRALATHCLCCNRPLRDAVSVEVGIGPDCREKYGYNAGPEIGRDEANKLIYLLLDAGSTASCNVADALDELESLGFVSLAEKLASLMATVEVEVDGDTLIVHAPYDEHFTQLCRNLPTRRWDGARKVNTFDYRQKNLVWGALRVCFAGKFLKSPKGFMRIEAP